MSDEKPNEKPNETFFHNKIIKNKIETVSLLKYENYFGFVFLFLLLNLDLFAVYMLLAFYFSSNFDDDGLRVFHQAL